ncbi:hypothetical protein NM962_03505 [Mycobacterium sp. SVM_VP21]|nr:hypothetical protein NM962_03505 [Mycobacterium sp. SVM_VP21]
MHLVFIGNPSNPDGVWQNLEANALLFNGVATSDPLKSVRDSLVLLFINAY